uniref:BZIP domain-containing protein n=1 Tax=Castor canadensis TaxID=51338 RepID=A0A8C0W366_CASCN
PLTSTWLPRPQPVKSELDEEEERRKRRREKNKVAASRWRNKKEEQTELLQQQSERLELMNELKTQTEELKQEPQQLIINRHRPTCIVRTDSVRTDSAPEDFLVLFLLLISSAVHCGGGVHSV